MNLHSFLTPSNLSIEREKFFSSSRYNPVFTYDWDPIHIEEWLQLKTQTKYRPFVQSVVSQDYERIRDESEQIFSTKLEDKYIKLAKDALAINQKIIPQESLLNLVKEFESVLAFLNIDYEVLVSDEEGFNIRPVHEEKKLIISKFVNFQYFSLHSLVRHEILHVIRSVNSKHNNIEKSLSYLPTEEGFACFVQDYSGTEENYSLFQHAAEYAVTNVGSKGSLRGMVEYLQHIGFNKDLAWQRAARHKFGFINTADSGDIMKPSMYFYNKVKVKELTTEERERLLVGKISIDDLPNYPEYKGIVDIHRIRSIFQL